MSDTDTTVDLDAAVRELADRQEILDALYRFGAGQDLKDAELFRSAFSVDATLDFTHPAERFGGDVPVMTSREVIAGIIDALAPLVTSHTVTNPRISIDGAAARLWALVEAQHVSRSEPGRHLLLKNTYDVDLARDGDGWVITHLVIRNIWHAGDPTVLFGDSARAPEALG